jgi:hypothetical protein
MTRPDLIGRLLVAAQFALLAWLIWPLTPQRWSLPALLLVGYATGLGLWTLFHNRPGNFNIRLNLSNVSAFLFAPLLRGTTERFDGRTRFLRCPPQIPFCLSSEPRLRRRVSQQTDPDGHISRNR